MTLICDSKSMFHKLARNGTVQITIANQPLFCELTDPFQKQHIAYSVKNSG